ncbi:DUF4097 family beta strand repeat-containing protein [Streptomyces sp. NPDC058877]|uniref:DUF4097 family beta strand repeat-containing protein n=1 Tax=Streptomyces sp. NPDC058877 TaxID=3346665 RepID=UPI0036ACEA3A
MHTFATPAAITVVLDVPAGRIRFIAADRTDTTVEVLPADAAKNRDVQAAERTGVSYANGVLKVATTTKNQYFGPSGAVEVTVRLPAGSGVEAKTAGTELRGVGRLGRVLFEGARGRIKLDEAESARLTVLDGDVEVGRLGGSSEISTQRGGIRIAEAVGGAFVLTTQLGDIEVGVARGVSGALDAHTTLGRIDNALKNDGTPGLSVRATTTRGDVTARSL